MGNLLKPLDMIAEWKKGCGNCITTEGTLPPESCQECTRALIAALEARLTQDASADGFPMQPVVVAELGVVRFKENRIANYLIECISSTSLVLNDIAKADFTEDERMQFAQLLGYSVCGYCDLSYASEESKDRASELAAALVGGAE